MKPIVKVEGLGKKYRIGAQQTSHPTLRESLAEMIRAPISRIRRAKFPSTKRETIWALRDVSFEVYPGEVIGIIGRNGAGKSTLLKILSRITHPTVGHADIYGRIGSLLEVGSGFHPELTGKENIYLNGAVLGMARREINSKFEEIVAFAEIEKFLDTPVKHYSSGMYMRLAFAVAAHLDPEILIMDEVLAVGDVSFQNKCLRKINDVASQGRTILFVSHNMHAVASLCQSVIWLDGGAIKSIGNAKEQVAKYTAAALQVRPVNSDPQGFDSPASVQNVRMIDANGEEKDSFDLFEPMAVELNVVQRSLTKPVRLVIRLRSAIDDSVVLATTDWDYGTSAQFLEACTYTIRCAIPCNFLNSGTYLVSVGIDEPNGPVHFRLDSAKEFTVVNTSPLGPGLYGSRDGVLSPYREWKVTSVQSLESRSTKQ